MKINDYKKDFTINKNKINVLIYPQKGSEFDEINSSLKYSHHVSLIEFSEYEISSLQLEHSFSLDYFEKCVQGHAVDLIMCTDIDFLREISKSTLLFNLIYGVNKELLKVLFSQKLLFQLFESYSWIPKFFQIDEYNVYPLTIIKGSKSILVNDAEEVERYINSVDSGEYLLTEYLVDKVVHVDCFTDMDGVLIWNSGRYVACNNFSVVNMLELEDEMKNIAQTLSVSLGFRGYWSFSLQYNNQGSYKLTSINILLNENLALYRSQGINIPLMVIQDFLNRKQIALQGNYCKKVFKHQSLKAILDYDFDNVFVDLDGTLIINEQVCPAVIAFIYQMIQENKKIFLITRHLHNPETTLLEKNIAASLFQEIIHITDGTLKSEFIPSGSIFIDNEFPERRDVFLNKNIPVLDVDTVELYLNLK